jgi:hypothetical protein
MFAAFSVDLAARLFDRLDRVKRNNRFDPLNRISS